LYGFGQELALFMHDRGLAPHAQHVNFAYSCHYGTVEFKSSINLIIVRMELMPTSMTAKASSLDILASVMGTPSCPFLLSNIAFCNAKGQF
jgi:hypothetical protein